MTRPRGPAARLEARRREALRLLERGLSLTQVGRILGCAPSSVMRWRDAVRRLGLAALRVRVPTGRPPRLSPRQHAELVTALQRGGLLREPGGLARVVLLIERRFGVRYHKAHVSRLLRRLGLRVRTSSRRPVRRP